MGLDMYLFESINGKLPTTDEEKEQLETVIYWRKANAIHKFLSDAIIEKQDLDLYEIENVGYYLVDYEILESLYQTCQKVLDNHDLASELLPTYQGFFYGTYEYDEYYFDNIKYTMNKLEELFKHYKKTDTFIYHVWW